MVTLLRKLDFCFASLLCGQDIDTKEPLPGFGNGVKNVMTRTHMVRCKSIVEQTRIVVVEVMSKQTGHEEEQQATTDDGSEIDTELDTDTELENTAEETGFVDPNWQDDDNDMYMDVARVYERTLVQLGEVLQNSVLP